MTPATPPQLPDPENLKQLPTEQLVAIILEQQRVIEQLTQAVNRLQGNRNQDSQTSSKPPSTDLLLKPEKAKALQQPETVTENPKRKPGGQPGHSGKTRKGFGRVDRLEILRPQVCPHCGSQEFDYQPVAVQMQQVAQLLEHPIEIVEYQRHSCPCANCGEVQIAAWPQSIVPGQDLGVSLQAQKSVVGQLRSSVLRKTARTVAGTRRYRHWGGNLASYQHAGVFGHPSQRQRPAAMGSRTTSCACG